MLLFASTYIHTHSSTYARGLWYIARSDYKDDVDDDDDDVNDDAGVEAGVYARRRHDTILFSCCFVRSFVNRSQLPWYCRRNGHNGTISWCSFKCMPFVCMYVQYSIAIWNGSLYLYDLYIFKAISQLFPLTVCRSGVISSNIYIYI